MAYETLKTAQKEAIQVLINSYHNQRLSHAYIFEGEAGTKKFDTALFFAALILCQSDHDKPCGTCHQCRRIHHHTHPNVYIVRPSTKQILKEDIRLLQEEFNKTALEEGAKIYIIEQADTMNQHASNALLKFLEEPHPNIYGILLTTNARGLLSTIRSRSQRIYFHALPKQTITTALLEDGYDEQLSRLASAMSHTMIEAQNILSLPNLYDVIESVTALYEAFINHDSLVLTFQKETEGMIRSNDDYALFLDVMIHYQNDLIYGKMNHYKKIIFQEHLATIETIKTLKTKTMLLEELEHMLELKSRLNHYINERLAFDNLMLILERRTAVEHE